MQKDSETQEEIGKYIHLLYMYRSLLSSGMPKALPDFESMALHILKSSNCTNTGTEKWGFQGFHKILLIAVESNPYVTE